MPALPVNATTCADSLDQNSRQSTMRDVGALRHQQIEADRYKPASLSFVICRTSPLMFGSPLITPYGYHRLAGCG
jgi:hypothetical protein